MKLERKHDFNPSELLILCSDKEINFKGFIFTHYRPLQWLSKVNKLWMAQLQDTHSVPQLLHAGQRRSKVLSPNQESANTRLTLLKNCRYKTYQLVCSH